MRVSASAKGNSTSSSLRNSATAPVNQIQEAISDNYVMIFSKTFCSYSTMVNMLLHDMNVNYKVVGLDMLEYRSQIQEVFYKVTSERSVLKIFVNGTFIESTVDTYRLHREIASTISSVLFFLKCEERIFVIGTYNLASKMSTI